MQQKIKSEEGKEEAFDELVFVTITDDEMKLGPRITHQGSTQGG